ncbi:MAG: hypothetical protein V5A32_02125 [Halovenus sp.]
MCGRITSPGGITRIKGGDQLAVDRRVVTLVTDRRILFTTPDENAVETVTLDYDQIVSLSSPGSELLELTTATGIGLEWPLAGETSWTSGTIRHLCWIGDVRNRLRSCQNDVELAAGEIRTHAERREWDEGADTYREMRAEIDDLCNLVFATGPVEPAVLAPELTEIERELEEANTRLLIERAQSQLDLARQLVGNGDYIQGRRVLGQAQHYYSRAQERNDAVKRGDAFQFGAQRELTEDLQRLGWQIETVAAEPVKQAHEAKIRAETATELSEELDHWETAFNRYGHVLTLEWGNDERNFAGDPGELRAEIERAASRLVDLHCRAGYERWNTGGELAETDEYKAALQSCLDAQAHLERAHELATEFEPARAEEIATRLEKMADAVIRMRNATAVGADETATEQIESRAETAAETPTDEQSKELPSASELTELDTHHELTLDTDEFSEQADDSNEVDHFVWHSLDDSDWTDDGQTNSAGNSEQKH